MSVHIPGGFILLYGSRRIYRGLPLGSKRFITKCEMKLHTTLIVRDHCGFWEKERENYVT